MAERGFIVHSFLHPSKPVLYMAGRLENGETFAITENRERPFFYIRETDYSIRLFPARPGKPTVTVLKSTFCTMEGAPLLQLVFQNSRELKQSGDFLQNRGIRTYEADVLFTDQYCIARRIHGTVSIKGSYIQGQWVNRIYQNPEVTPCDFFPSLTVLSLDIETSAEGREIRAISLAGTNPWKKLSLQEVLLLGPAAGKEFIRSYADERGLLKAFACRVRDFDPDIITGWNVIDFDFAVIAARFNDLGLSMNFGRSSRQAFFLPGGKLSRARIILPGRQVIDSMWLLRAAPERYTDYRLETVARQLLGEGKEVAAEGRDKLEALEKMYSGDPAAFASYCLQDAVLVQKILEKTHLMDLTIKRCLLTGVDMERAWTSIRPFEHLYMEALHARGMIAPTRGVDTAEEYGAGGGLVFSPESALFRNVFIFDFKSLYPSLIRTFNIDPVSFVFRDPDPAHNENSVNYIKAPNGACFSRQPGILPAIVTEFFKNREQAKKEKDVIASYVYKILMNSFYGVLGTPGCRFASSLFAGAITGFGQQFLLWCRELLTGRGLPVIYGDTDSLFVQSSLPPDSGYRELQAQGEEIRNLVNGELSRYIREQYNVESQLDLEFEKIYSRFFIPPIRSFQEPGDNPAVKGRTKGYAGLILPAPGHEHEAALVEIKGMEAVRSDWTELAHEFQIRLITLLFAEVPHDEIAAYISKVLEELRAGRLDEKLIYHKSLRRPVSSYTKTKPPQVKAAEKLGWKNQTGRVEYWITLNGAEPCQLREAPVDYEHYIEKQLKPIAYAMEKVFTFKLAGIFDDDPQPWLFTGNE